MSVGDVSCGFRRALERQGHEISDYSLMGRLMHHERGVGVGEKDPTFVSRLASETIANEAMYFNADLVLIVSGLNLHPIALWLLGKVGIRVAVIFTESPYQDARQFEWSDLSQTGASVDLTAFTNDRYSSQQFGWHFLPPAIDPEIHKPPDVAPEIQCDVMMIGTGWPDRQAFLEAVNWSGIRFQIYGSWPNITEASPLHRFYCPLIVENEDTPEFYRSATINLNLNRQSSVAMTPGPRVFELAACGAFQISDPREDLINIFGDAIPIFRTPKELETQIRKYMTLPDHRQQKAEQAKSAVKRHTFDDRADELISVVTTQRK